MQCWWIFDFETDYNLETKALKLCVEKKVRQSFKKVKRTE
jgi:DNA replication protein DnaD